MSMQKTDAYFRNLAEQDERDAATAEEDRLEREARGIWGKRYNPACRRGEFCPHGCGWCREATE